MEICLTDDIKDRSWLIFQDIKISRYFDMNRRYDLTSPEAELLSTESHQNQQGCQPRYKVIPSQLVFRKKAFLDIIAFNAQIYM